MTLKGRLTQAQRAIDKQQPAEEDLIVIICYVDDDGNREEAGRLVIPAAEVPKEWKGKSSYQMTWGDE